MSARLASSKKTVPLVPALVTLGLVGGVAASTVQFYRHPTETFNSLLRTRMLLTGAREERCDVDGLAMRYFCAGRRGTPLVLIHGLGGSAEAWVQLMPRLSKEYLVYAPDLPGFGKTPLAPEGYTIRTHVLYLRRFLDALGYPQVALVGNSLGGWIATMFAAEYPERVEHLYLLNSAGLQREEGHSPHATNRKEAQRSMEYVMGRPFPVKLPGFVLDAVVNNSQTPAYRGFIEHYDKQEELDLLLEKVKAPTTIIWGTADGLFPLTCAYDFHNGIVNSKLILLPGIGHVPQAQAAAEVARIILANASERAIVKS
ncbi:MAG: alpha/beta fold hydrolase [Ktedonobacteraceae bacterium]